MTTISHQTAITLLVPPGVATPMVDSCLSGGSSNLPTVSDFIRLGMGNRFWFTVSSWFQASLVPRLPRSGTQTLKLCRRGEPGIFSQVRSGKGREDLIVRGHTRNSEQEKERR